MFSHVENDQPVRSHPDAARSPRTIHAEEGTLMAALRTSWRYYDRSEDEDAKPTDELPMVRLAADEAPPSFPHPVRRRVTLTGNGEAQRALAADKCLTVSYYDPREPLMIIDVRTSACHTEPVGTRAIPLRHYVGERGGAYRAMIDARRAGVSAAIGHDYLLLSDEVNQGECTRMAAGF